MRPIYNFESQSHNGWYGNQCAYLAGSVLSVSNSRLLVTEYVGEQLDPQVPIVVNAVALSSIWHDQNQDLWLSK